MSSKRKRGTARERLRLERERQRQLERERERRFRRRRLVGISAGVLTLVLLVVVIGVVVQRQRAHDDGPSPHGAVAGGLGIPVGQRGAPVTLTVYEDFRCPACGDFEDRYSATVDKLVTAGKLRVEYHVATVIDANPQAGGEGSKVAGNAAACAQDTGRFRAYHAQLYAHQPREDTDGFTEHRVIQLARQVRGLDTARFRSCVGDERYRPWLKRVQAGFDHRFDQVVTPTLVLDGKVVLGGQDQAFGKEIRTPEALDRAVTRKAAARTATPTSASPGS